MGSVGTVRSDAWYVNVSYVLRHACCVFGVLSFGTSESFELSEKIIRFVPRL